ncbi:hypothetical protein NPIL_410781 [Nephila pilipes]|uniref:Uncharacterized protein n=1 Tax=Nephila pilipes TaxID=299642 RepID=A0A8X6MX45_NEPPI|nr:hypothetical protein NPIL_360051 [Nephila pilipes]GFT18568.1 hypothetical protein NPIL_410781 [Nephila pilipes]
MFQPLWMEYVILLESQGREVMTLVPGLLGTISKDFVSPKQEVLPHTIDFFGQPPNQVGRFMFVTNLRLHAQVDKE